MSWNEQSAWNKQKQKTFEGEDKTVANVNYEGGFIENYKENLMFSSVWKENGLIHSVITIWHIV